jgi:Arc/MetJ-type ribon-helix-helix transcriptional regulator
MSKSGDEAAEGDLGTLRVRLDSALQADIDEARRRTGIRTTSELVRLALRKLAQGDEARLFRCASVALEHSEGGQFTLATHRTKAANFSYAIDHHGKGEARATRRPRPSPGLLSPGTWGNLFRKRSCDCCPARRGSQLPPLRRWPVGEQVELEGRVEQRVGVAVSNALAQVVSHATVLPRSRSACRSADTPSRSRAPREDLRATSPPSDARRRRSEPCC